MDSLTRQQQEPRPQPSPQPRPQPHRGPQSHLNQCLYRIPQKKYLNNNNNCTSMYYKGSVYVWLLPFTGPPYSTQRVKIPWSGHGQSSHRNKPYMNFECKSECMMLQILHIFHIHEHGI